MTGFTLSCALTREGGCKIWLIVTKTTVVEKNVTPLRLPKQESDYGFQNVMISKLCLGRSNSAINFQRSHVFVFRMVVAHGAIGPRFNPSFYHMWFLYRGKNWEPCVNPITLAVLPGEKRFQWAQSGQKSSDKTVLNRLSAFFIIWVWSTLLDNSHPYHVLPGEKKVLIITVGVEKLR